MDKSSQINLPRYKCCCIPHLYCPFCKNKRSLSYGRAIKVWKTSHLSLDLQIPQCHICTRFETNDNPLFAYSYLEGEDGDYKFIYRCLKGHGHDFGMSFLDIQTNLEICL